MKLVFARILGFGLIPLLSSVAPMLLLPVVARTGGPDGWTSYAVGQSVGGFGSVLTVWGWNVTGPARAARARSRRDVERLYRESLAVRMPVFGAVVCVTTALTGFLVPREHMFDSALMAAATSILGLSLAWFAIGIGRPIIIAKYETFPRLMAVMAALPVILLTRTIWPYPAMLLVATIGGLIAFQRSLTPKRSAKLGGFPHFVLGLRGNFSPATVEIIGGTYSNAPMPIATAFDSPGSTASLASGDKLYRYGLFAVTALANGLQSWVVSASGAQWRSRQRVAILAHGTLGLVGLLLMSILGPTVSGILFGPDVASSAVVCIFLGVAFFAISLSTPIIRNHLVPYGRTRLVMWITMAASLIGLSGMVVLGGSAGTMGVVIAFAASESAVLVLAAYGAMSSSMHRTRRYPGGRHFATK